MAQPSRASPDLFGDDSEDDLWLNDVFEGENDPEVLQQVTSAVAEFQARDRPEPVQEVQPDVGIRSRANNKFQMSSSPDVLEIDSDDEDQFPAGQGGFLLTQDWNGLKTPVSAWNLSPEPEKKKPVARGEGKPSKPPGAKKRKRDRSLDSDNGAGSTLPIPGTAAASLSWVELLRQHQALLASKGKVNGRKFNKTALDLLNYCASKVTQHPGLFHDSSSLLDGSSKWQQTGPFPSTSSAALATAGAGGSKSPQWEGEKEALSEFRSLLLNAKEIQSEEMTARVVAYVEKGLPALLTADEKRDLLLKRSLAFVQELSPQLSLKMGPVIRSYVHQIFDTELENLFATIRMPERSARDKALQYRRMFTRFLDDRSCVTFACTNKALLGKLPPRDVWFLTFFAFVTSRRVRGDNLLQLGCSGTCVILFSLSLSLMLTQPNLTQPNLTRKLKR